jgi:hypothetical protein
LGIGEGYISGTMSGTPDRFGGFGGGGLRDGEAGGRDGGCLVVVFGGGGLRCVQVKIEINNNEAVGLGSEVWIVCLWGFALDCYAMEVQVWWVRE